jgi:hypothetical protein
LIYFVFMKKLPPITVALISDLPDGREPVIKGLESFGANVVWDGEDLGQDDLVDKKPDLLLLAPEGIIRSPGDLRAFKQELGELLPETKLLVRADWGSRSLLGRECLYSKIPLVSASVDWQTLILKMRQTVEGQHGSLEAKVPLVAPRYQDHGRGRGWRV